MSGLTTSLCTRLPVAQVKSLAEAYSKAHTEVVEAESQEQAPAAAEETTAATDPTVANASLTEMKAGEDTALANGNVEEQPAATPANAAVSDETANASGEKWDTSTSANELSGSTLSQEWVNVSRETTEVSAAPAAGASPAPDSQSWADDQPEQSTEVRLNRYIMFLPSSVYRLVLGRRR